MARHAGWESIPMAEGGKDPIWPLPSVTPKFATWSLGGGRPFGCAAGKCERWHAGVDLTGAPQGALVIAPEDGKLVGLDKGWTDGTRAIFMVTDSGLFLVLGGIIAGSHKEFSQTPGARVKRGDKLGRIVGSYGMLHFETYAATPDRVTNSRWWKDDPPPEGLRNPIHYLERMIGAKASLLQTRQRLEALKQLGHYTGDVDAAWGAPAIDALKKAQAALGVQIDGTWGPETEDAIQRALQPPDGTEEGGKQFPITPRRIVGGMVAGLTIAGLTAAIAVTLRRRRPEAAP
jgi:hypothetical protein